MFSSLTVRLGALIMLSAACSDASRSAGPISPPPTFPPAAPPAVNPTPPFPALVQPGEIFTAPDTLYDVFMALEGSHIASRYVLNDSTSTFRLQFSSYFGGFGEYAGHYSAANSVLTLSFGEESRWQATGTFRGDSLFIKYNEWAALSDFIDGAYIRSPTH